MPVFSITDTATPALRDLIRGLVNTRPLMAACGKRVEVELKAHFAMRQGEGNKHGWADKQFWSGASTRSVSANVKLQDVSALGATVVIDDPRLAFRLSGGTLTPKRGKYLAIPMRQEAYEAGSPRERNVDDLKFVPTRNGGLLVQRDATSISFGRKRKDGSRSVQRGPAIGGLAMYALVRSVTQAADPRALPTRASLQDAVLDETKSYLIRTIK